MKNRFTIEELNNKNSPLYLHDLVLISKLIQERISELSNSYAPLSVRLNNLQAGLEALIFLKQEGYKERKFAEIFAAEDIVIQIVEVLNNNEDIKETINCF